MERLIQADGQPRIGIFPQGPALVNYRDYDLRSPMGRRLGPLARWRRFHQFQYFGLISDTLIGGCALADLRVMGVGFVYLYHPASGRRLMRQFKLPLGLGTRFSQTPDAGVCELRWRGNLLRMDNRDGAKRLEVSLDDGLRIEAAFDERTPPFQPMHICTPAGPAGWVYARKVAGVRCSGQVSSPLGDFDLAALDCFAHHDWSAGYMRRETYWNWACLSGAVDGGRVGLNLSCGVNETSFSENCFWLDGALFPVGGVRFEFDRDRPLDPWRIHSGDGQVELTFTGQGLHGERVNALLLASNFKQVYGRFNGWLRPPGHVPIRLTDQWGFCEDHYARW